MNFNQTKIFGAIVILAYLLIPVLFFQNMINLDSHNHLMEMSGCPYMDDRQAICPMDFSFYLGIWNLISAIDIQNMNIFVLILALGVLSWFVFKSLQIYKPNFYFKSQRYRSIPNLYQFLFRKGILNSKAY